MPDDDADLGQHDDRQHAEHGEHRGEQDAGAGDHPAGDAQRVIIPSRVPCTGASSRARVTRKML